MTSRVARYLRFRGLSGEIPDALDFAPALEYFDPDRPGETVELPAMIARVVALDGELVTLHRTYLDPNGAGKAAVANPRKLMPPPVEGATMGAAVRLGDPGDGDVLALTEGIETGLAVMEATGLPVWAAISANGLKAVNLPRTVSRVYLFGDNDVSRTGQQAADYAAARFEAENRKAFVRIPRTPGADWLDVLNDAGPAPIRAALDEEADPPGGRPLTDLGNAERLVDAYGRDLRHDHGIKSWFFWNGAGWEADRTGQVNRYASATVRTMYRQASEIESDDLRRKLAAHARESEASKALSAMIKLAASLEGVPIVGEAWDVDPWLLSTPAGVVDLRTAETRPHRRRDLQLKQTAVAYDPHHPTPLWTRYLREVTDGDEELEAYLKAVAGYTLTGDVREDVFFVHYGGGRNGKGTFWNLLRAILGTYAAVVAPETFAVQSRGSNNATPELMAIQGKRYILTSESEDGVRLHESLIKRLTGRDPITARPLYGAPVSFLPACKLHYLTNHKPHVTGTDAGIWSRIRLVPWLQNFEGREDKTLDKKLWKEAPGILAWFIAGCLEWQAGGLPRCAAVEEASAAYRVEQDTLGAFLAEKVIKFPGHALSRSSLYETFKTWIKDNGHREKSSKWLTAKLLERGFKQASRASDGHRWADVGLASE